MLNLSKTDFLFPVISTLDFTSILGKFAYIALLDETNKTSQTVEVVLNYFTNYLQVPQILLDERKVGKKHFLKMK